MTVCALTRRHTLEQTSPSKGACKRARFSKVLRTHRVFAESRWLAKCEKRRTSRTAEPDLQLGAKKDSKRFSRLVTCLSSDHGLAISGDLICDERYSLRNPNKLIQLRQSSWRYSSPSSAARRSLLLVAFQIVLSDLHLPSTPLYLIKKTTPFLRHLKWSLDDSLADS